MSDKKVMVMDVLRRRLYRMVDKETKRQKWFDEHARVVAVKEPDGQMSIFIHVPRYLKKYRPSGLVKDSLKTLDWPSKRRVAMFGHVMPRDIRWFDIRNRPYRFSNKEFLASPTWPPFIQTTTSSIK